MVSIERRRRCRLLPLVLLTGCYTGLGDPIDDPLDLDPTGQDGSEEGEEDGGAAACTEPSAGPPVLQRLTRAEYANTVEDLLGVPEDVTAGFVADGVLDGFATNAVIPVTPLQVEGYLAAAEALAAEAVQSNPALLPCDPTVVGARPCAQSFIDAFAPRAFRRPPAPEVREGLLAVYDHGETFDDGMRLVITAVLQSPDFLYRVERTRPEPEAGRLRLDGYSMASRLSYLLWRTMPDDDLLGLAAADALDSPDALEEQARRMLEDPRSAALFADFHRQWLGIQDVEQVAKDPERFPDAPQLLPAMATETAWFVDRVLRHEDARLRTLLTARWTVVDATLAEHYGLDPAAGITEPGLPEGWFVAELPAEQRAGLLTQGSVLAAHAKADRGAPILRGAFTREQILCTPLPDPPPDVPPPPAIDPEVPERDRLEQHSSDPACAGCHGLIDELGFAYEHYDAMGGFRLVDEEGHEVDAKVELGSTDVDGTYDGAVELAQALAASAQVRDCVATQWFRYANARPARADDACDLELLQDSFADTDGDVHELVVSIVRRPSFLYVEQ